MRVLGTKRPAPGTVIAIVALIVALAGTAAALPGRNTVNSGDIKSGAVKRSDQARDQRTEWALIDLDSGTIVKQSGGISLESPGANSGFADFGHSVAGRPIHATAEAHDGTVDSADVFLCGSAPQGIECTPFGRSNRHVFVRTDAPGPEGARVYLSVLPK